MGTNRGKKIYTRRKPQPHRWLAPIERVYALGSDCLRQSGYLQVHGILKIYTMVIFTCTHSGHESRKEDIYKTKTPATSLVATHSTCVCTWIGLPATIWLQCCCPPRPYKLKFSYLRDLRICCEQIVASNPIQA